MKETAPYGLQLSDLYLFNTGGSYHCYRFMGAHPITYEGAQGIRFTVWAPAAKRVSVIGDWNNWSGERDVLKPIGTTGIHSIFIPHLETVTAYKYEILTSDQRVLQKADPFAFYAERRPSTASLAWQLDDYEWSDEQWQLQRSNAEPYSRPLLIYEAHAASWRIHGEQQFYSFDELAESLIPYVKDLGFTHIELLPLAEHPLDKSWGYQITGFYAVTSRHGTPVQFKRFVDKCHQAGIGVILDWVPGHFCKDDHGLRQFDGTPLFEGECPKRAEKLLWGTLAFDYSRNEVRSFLIANALFWLEEYHLDGLRVDAVASMLDLHMDKPPHLHTYNELGGTDNLDAIRFLKILNETIYRYYPHTLMLAEDSSARPAVTSPVYMGGLGFNFKWNMGWMNDVLTYMSLPASQRPSSHHLLTFSISYMSSENYVLPLSHDEVVHGKKSLLDKMPGTYEEKFAQLRLFYGLWIAHPGKKLLFMGGEFGQFVEWKDSLELDWLLLQYEAHRQTQDYVRQLMWIYRAEAALWQEDRQYCCFEWIDVHNAAQAVISFIRWSKDGPLVIAANFSLTSYDTYRIGVPESGRYRMLIHSESAEFGGMLGGTNGLEECEISTDAIGWHGKEQSLTITLPRYSFVMLKLCSNKRKKRRDFYESKGNDRYASGRGRGKTAWGTNS